MQQAQDEHLQKMVDLANQARLPMDEIQAMVSTELTEAVKKATTPVDEDNQEK